MRWYHAHARAGTESSVRAPGTRSARTPRGAGCGECVVYTPQCTRMHERRAAYTRDLSGSASVCHRHNAHAQPHRTRPAHPTLAATSSYSPSFTCCDSERCRNAATVTRPRGRRGASERLRRERYCGGHAMPATRMRASEQPPSCLPWSLHAARRRRASHAARVCRGRARIHTPAGTPRRRMQRHRHQHKFPRHQLPPHHISTSTGAHAKPGASGTTSVRTRVQARPAACRSVRCGSLPVPSAASCLPIGRAPRARTPGHHGALTCDHRVHTRHGAHAPWWLHLCSAL